MPHNLDTLLQSIMQQAEEQSDPKGEAASLLKKQRTVDISPLDADVQIARLEEFLDIYEEENPYDVGDLVTPRAHTMQMRIGQPHKVIEVMDRPHVAWDSGDELGNPDYGARLDIKVAVLTGKDKVNVYWTESWRFEPYVEE